ncbi:MAG: HEAT repeat domain-containing protein [Planctomycetota bacterium]|jgi:acetyl esterase/lipase
MVRIPVLAWFSILIFLGAAPREGTADLVYTKSSRQPLEGIVLEDGPDAVRINVHYSDNPKMTWEVVTVPKPQVIRVILDRPKIQEYLRQASALPSGKEAEKHFALALWCKKNKLKVQMKERARHALLADPTHEGALKMLGASAKDFLAREQKTREKIVPLIEAYAAEEDPEKRKTVFRDLKALGFKKRQTYLDRVVRSFASPKGRHLDRKIVFRAEVFPGAVYSILVPKDYHPLRAWPLVLGLHGGGAAGKDGKEVVGSGPSAMQKYQHQAASRGYILVCPTAITAPWPNKVNEEFITALLLELALTYNIDLNRVYLVGHSMGGGGTWNYGPKWAETFASVAPLSAYGSSGFTRLHRTGTGVYIYHGDNDPRCPVQSSRTAAHALKKLGADYRYTEIPGSGHACPMYIVKEVFDFFDTHRLKPAKKPSLFGMRTKGWGMFSSFEEIPFTPEEKRYLSERKASGVLGLVHELAKGGGAAEKAAVAIAGHEEKAKAFPALRALLFRSENEDVRRLAAWTLGAIGMEKAVKPLAQALDDPVPPVRGEAAEALAKIGGEAACNQITRGAALILKHFESRLVGNRQLDSVDWEIQVATWIRFLSAAGKIGNEKTAAALGKTVFEGVLLKDFNIDYDREVQPDPKRSLHRLALAALKAMEKIKSPLGSESVKKLLEKMGSVPKVAAKAKRVLEKLSG